MEIIESIAWFGLGFVSTLILLQAGAKSYTGTLSRRKADLIQEVAA